MEADDRCVPRSCGLSVELRVCFSFILSPFRASSFGCAPPVERSAHHFPKLLHSKTGKLTRVYTQNIDGLIDAVDLPDDRVISVHGTIGRASCEACGAATNFDEFCDRVESKIKNIYDGRDGGGPAGESEPIRCDSCGRATVKPDTVLFGSSLPAEFFDRAESDLPSADLLVVAGTSLVVGPANSLVYRVPETTRRVIVNDEPVGRELGVDYGPNAERDFFARGKCEDVFLDLICELGWLQDLNEVVDNLPEGSVELIRARRS